MGHQGQTQILSDARSRHAIGGRIARPAVTGSVRRFLDRFAKDEAGSTAVEYSIIAVIISIAAVGALAIIGPTVMGMFADAAAGF